MKCRGFILQATYRMEDGRPVLHLHGCREGGGSFFVRDSRETPHFFVRAQDRRAAEQLGASPLSPTGFLTLRGEDEVLRVDEPTPSDAVRLRDRLVAQEISTYEADVRFSVRSLIDRGIRGSVEISGEARPGAPGQLLFADPDIRASTWSPTLRTLSFDIETDPSAQRLLAISLHGLGAAEVFLVDSEGRRLPDNAVACGCESELLERFASRVRDLDPDVLTGWNIVDFDLPVLLRVASRTRARFEVGRGAGETRVVPPRSRRELPKVNVPGRLVLDGIHLLRGAFVRMDSYSLDSVARQVLGEGKTLSGKGRGTEILRLFREDIDAFVEYSLTDARLVSEILETLRLVELSVERSLLTGMTPDRVSGAIASFDYLYLMELRRRGRVAPTVSSSSEAGVTTGGGHVLEPRPGLYRNVVALDFKSLYPSLIRTFQIDPLGYCEEASEIADPIVAPNGAAFHREKGILTSMLDELFPRREDAKRAGDSVKSQAIKILMNSFYGVLGASVCRFHNPRIANAITSFGRELLLWSKDRIESYGHLVLYGDTDSLFVETGVESSAQAHEIGADLAGRVNRDLEAYLSERWGVESGLELEFETLYLRLVLTPVRGGGAGARKRYVGLVEDGEKSRVVFIGMEAVRRDWTDLAKTVQKELYERLFSDRPVEDYLREVARRLKAGEFMESLIYRKGLRKPADEYTSTTPPHVAAARKMKGEVGRVIEYVMTVDGPEPARERKADLDLRHYLQKQIRPVAEPVLSLLGLDFEGVITGQQQLRLF